MQSMQTIEKLPAQYTKKISQRDSTAGQYATAQPIQDTGTQQWDEDVWTLSFGKNPEATSFLSKLGKKIQTKTGTDVGPSYEIVFRKKVRTKSQTLT